MASGRFKGSIAPLITCQNSTPSLSLLSKHRRRTGTKRGVSTITRAFLYNCCSYNVYGLHILVVSLIFLRQLLRVLFGYVHLDANAQFGTQTEPPVLSFLRHAFQQVINVWRLFGESTFGGHVCLRFRNESLVGS